MIVKGARTTSFWTMWKTSLVFKILVTSLPLTVSIFATYASVLTISIAVVPFVLIWKLILTILFVRRRRSLTELDPLSARDRNDTNKKFHFLRSWWNYAVLVVLVTAYCGMISYNAAAGWYPPAVIAQTILMGLDTVALATLVFAIARLHKLAYEEARLRSKGVEMEVGAAESDDGDEESNIDNDGTSSVDAPPPAYNQGRAPPSVVCMMCAATIPHGEKVLIQPSLR